VDQWAFAFPGLRTSWLPDSYRDPPDLLQTLGPGRVSEAKPTPVTGFQSWQQAVAIGRGFAYNRSRLEGSTFKAMSVLKHPGKIPQKPPRTK